MQSAHFQVFIDWGTTNLRAYLVAPDGRCVDERQSSQGVKSIPAGTCHIVLQSTIGDWISEFDKPRILMAGMVGSELGICEVSLQSAPCSLGDFQRNLCRFELPNGWEAEVIPGVVAESSTIPGVMRGEEVQALGAVELAEVSDALVCMPGTHTKWVSLSNREIVSISTFMTGEIFSLMRNDSVLTDLVACDESIDRYQEGFVEGLELAKSGRSIAQLMFSIRTEAVAFGQIGKCRDLARLSGMLIGSEIYCSLSELDENDHLPVLVSASDALAEGYGLALKFFGRSSQVIDSNATFLAGCKIISGMPVNSEIKSIA